MRNKDKNVPLTPHFFPGSTSLLHSQLLALLSSKQHRRMGNGGCCQFVTLHFCRSFRITLFSCSSGSLHRQQFLREYPPVLAQGHPQPAMLICAPVPGTPLAPPLALVCGGQFLTHVFSLFLVLLGSGLLFVKDAFT